MLTHFFVNVNSLISMSTEQAYNHHIEKQTPGFTFTLSYMSKYNNTTKILFSYGTSKSVSNIQYCSIIFHDLPHCDSSSEPEVESWQWSTSTGRSSKPPSFKQILVHPSLCVWTSALTIDALKIEFQAYIFNIFISYFMYMLGVDYHILYILK